MRKTAGTSGHADYLTGWDTTPRPDLFGTDESVMQHWVNQCLHGLKDGHAALLCDDVWTLY